MIIIMIVSFIIFARVKSIGRIICLVHFDCCSSCCPCTESTVFCENTCFMLVVECIIIGSIVGTLVGLTVVIATGFGGNWNWF